MAIPKLAIRGLLANIEAGLVLKFQFNPNQIATTKAVNYEITDIPGWDHPDITWVSGGVKRIKFSLLFDRSPASSTFNAASPKDFRTVGVVPLVGTEAVKAVIESFLYPQRDLLSFLGSTAKFLPPPKGLLILGTRFFEVKMEGDSELVDMLHDSTLTPVRLMAAMSLIVLEEGKINELSATKRNALAKAESAFSLVDVSVDVFTRVV